MEAGLGALVKQSLGPLPLIPAEQALLDLERARMKAEDYSQGNAPHHGSQTWRQTHRSCNQKILSLANVIANVDTVVQWHECGQTDASDRPLTPEHCLAQIRAKIDVVMVDDSESEVDLEADTEPESDEDSEDEDMVTGHVFHVGDRVRVSPNFGGYAELRGASGTVTHVDMDVTVRLDAPVRVHPRVTWQTFTHSPHNFEHLRE